MYGMEFNYYYILGAIFVVIGFVIMVLFESETLGPKMTNRYLMDRCRGKKHADLEDGEEYGSVLLVESNKFNNSSVDVRGVKTNSQISRMKNSSRLRPIPRS